MRQGACLIRAGASPFLAFSSSIPASHCRRQVQINTFLHSQDHSKASIIHPQREAGSPMALETQRGTEQRQRALEIWGQSRVGSFTQASTAPAAFCTPGSPQLQKGVQLEGEQHTGVF